MLIDWKQKWLDLLNRLRGNTWQNSTSFHDRNIQQTRIWRKFVDLIMSKYRTPAANIVFEGERPDIFSQKWGRKQGCLLLLLLFDNVLDILARTVLQEKEMKSIQTRYEDVKLSSLAYDLYIENSKQLTKKTY